MLHRDNTLYADNWYSSPKLFLTLSFNYKTNFIGTVRANRKNMPKDLCKVKLKSGEYTMRSWNLIPAVKWEDKRDVHIMTIKQETVEMVTQVSKYFETKLCYRVQQGNYWNWSIRPNTSIISNHEKIYERISKNFLLSVRYGSFQFVHFIQQNK